MDSQIELMNILENEINTLNIKKENIDSEYNKCSLDILSSFDELRKIKEEMESKIKEYDDEIRKKTSILFLPLIGLVFLGCLICTNGIFLGLGVDSIISYLVSFILSCGIVSVYNHALISEYNIYFDYGNDFKSKIVTKIRKYVLKKCPYLEEIYKEIIFLEESLIQKETELKSLQKEKDLLRNKIINIDKLIRTKKEELGELGNKFIEIEGMYETIKENELQTDVKKKMRRIENN